ncbi:proton extrusion protein PcxA [Tolypothrix sp. PCC 7910]|uniref:proton extrusion protein PcxA n=1 Tax=Tolypothrix sp. PCC 7910 TaxID=2099387 RepID=UPI00142771F4|nr:proton extrusion protein PcxA [Tolypothrix sp. PCC 7910]QIR40185.1 proton extrusion protein PcxA [Tolypothrix sp. PCC 7910]
MKSSFITKNAGLLRQKVRDYILTVKQWFVSTPERSLLEAYEAAQIIRNIEIEHFGNQKISASSADYTENVMSYWEGYLNKNLTIINIKLAEFRVSRSMLESSNSDILEKLQFIDDVISQYLPRRTQINNGSPIQISEPLAIDNHRANQPANASPPRVNKVPKLNQKTGVLPRSLGRTINRIKADLSPEAEEQFVRNYQISRNRTRIALRFFLLLILVPLLTQHFSKHLLINPIVDKARGESATQLFLNSEMEEKALTKLRNFENKLKFESLLQEAPTLSAEDRREKIQEKAIEIAGEFYYESNSAISNIFADLISLVAFGIVVAMSKKEIVIIKAFLDEIVYGLSDSAKAFIIILFTDIFVGFHSPHGWDVLLEGLAEHLGLPANRSAIYLFIATFPVILDTIFKYWIFRYLSRLSPSALATMKEMNE